MFMFSRTVRPVPRPHPPPRLLSTPPPTVSALRIERIYVILSGPYEGRGPKERLAEVAFVTALAGGSLALGLGTADQVANGAFAVLLSIPLRYV